MKLAEAGYGIVVLSTVVFAGAYIWRQCANLRRDQFPWLVDRCRTGTDTGLAGSFWVRQLSRIGHHSRREAAAVVAFFSAIGAAAYMVIFFTTWLPAVIVWVLIFIPLLVAVAKSPTAA